MLKLLEKLGYAPRIAVWELTLACDLHCRHCGSRAGKARTDELSLSEARGLCHELAELGCKHVTLSGGEPLLRKDWALIAKTLVDCGIEIAMISNGSAWTDAIATTVRAIGFESVGFSLDGLEEAHEYQRRVPGHWQRVLRAIDSAVQAGITVTVVTTINKRNLGELEQLRTLLCEHGVMRWQLQFATATGNMADERGLLMEPADLLQAVPLIARLCRDDHLPKVYAGHDVGYFGEPEESLRDQTAVVPYWTGCLAGMHVIGIESNGNIKGCLSLPSALNGVDAFVEGNIRQTPLREIWSRKGAFSYCRDFKVESLGGFCRTCEYNDICRGGCTWTCYAEQGFVRDNRYCYFRQLSLEQAGESGSQPKHLPVVT